MRLRQSTLILVAVVAALAFVWGRPPAAAAQDNTAVAINTKDGTSIFRVAFKISRVTGEVVDNGNAAVAFASCDECQALAAAFQVVLVFSDPAVVTPENLALAINYECTSCVAFASAYQWVLTTGGPVHFTAAGNKRLAEVRRRLHELSKADLTLDQLIAELEALSQEIADVIASEMMPAGPPQEEPATTQPTETATTPRTTTTEPTTTEGTTSSTTTP